MPQMQNLILTDRASTPVNHTFVPEAIDLRTGVASVVKTNGVPVGDKRFTISTRKTGSRRKSHFRLVLPVVATQTVNGIDTPVVVRIAYADVQFNFDVTSSEQERKDCVGMIASALDTAKTLVNDTIVKLESVY